MERGRFEPTGTTAEDAAAFTTRLLGHLMDTPLVGAE